MYRCAKTGLAGIAPHNAELFNAVHKHIHAGNSRGEQVNFLSIEFEGAVFLAFFFQVQSAVE